MGFVLVGKLTLASGLICDSCSSGQRFAHWETFQLPKSGFLQIPPHDGHLCLWLNLPATGRTRDFHPIERALTGRTKQEAPRRCAGELLRIELQQSGEVLDGADHLRNVGVLIVVPGNDLNLRGAVLERHRHSLSGIEQGAEAHADDVGGDDLVFVVAEGLGGFLLHLGVDLVDGDVALDNGVEDGGGAGGSRDTLCRADELGSVRG